MKTKENIIKALEICIDNSGDCTKCPYYMTPERIDKEYSDQTVLRHCSDYLMIDARKELLNERSKENL